MRLGSGEQPPALAGLGERMLAAIGEREPGPGDEIGHGARHQHFAGGCVTADAARAFDGDAADPFAGCDVALAGVQAEGSGAAETRTGGGQRARTGDGSSRARRTPRRILRR